MWGRVGKTDLSPAFGKEMPFLAVFTTQRQFRDASTETLGVVDDKDKHVLHTLQLAHIPQLSTEML